MNAFIEAVWAFLINPNVAYVFLVLGLWSVVLAIAMPGTGLPETAAVVCLALAALGLAQWPLNWAALALIGLAFLLFVAELQWGTHGALFLAGGILLSLGSLFLFRVENGVQAAFSWLTIVVVGGSSTVGFGALAYTGLAARRLPRLQDPDRVVGTTGVAQTDVRAEGAVYAAGELWSASAENTIPAGSPVVVVERRGMHLKVARV